MEFNPPPVDSQMINERLAPLDGPPQLQNQLHSHNEQYNALNDWFSMFGNVKAIEGNGNIESVWVPIDQSIAGLLEAKEKEAERLRQEEERKIQQVL